MLEIPQVLTRVVEKTNIYWLPGTVHCVCISEIDIVLGMAVDDI